MMLPSTRFRGAVAKLGGIDVAIICRVLPYRVCRDSFTRSQARRLMDNEFSLHCSCESRCAFRTCGFSAGGDHSHSLAGGAIILPSADFYALANFADGGVGVRLTDELRGRELSQ